MNTLDLLDPFPGTRLSTVEKRFGDRGFFLEPTVVSGVRQDDEIVQEQVFTPRSSPFCGSVSKPRV
ncbi:hypothetical protein KIPE111705_10235 [Kibdelosporangium persicum]